MIHRRCYISAWASVPERGTFEPWTAAEAIGHLAANRPNEVPFEEINAITAVVASGTPAPAGPTRLQLLALRHYEDRPLQYSPGAPLAAVNLPPGYYTADVTHVVIWPDGFAASDFHVGGPSLSRLSSYVRHKVDMHVHFQSLYDPSIAATLADLSGQLRSVDIALTSPGRSADAQPGVFSNLFPAAFGDKAPTVSVKLGMGRFGPRDRYLAGEVQEAAIQVAENASELVDKMILVGRSRATGQAVTVNVLNSRIYGNIELVPAAVGSNLPDTAQTFDEIVRVYDQMKKSDDLAKALVATSMRRK